MYTFFFTEASPFSQWYRCCFVVDGVTFNCAEQFMMHGKAMLFADAETAPRRSSICRGLEKAVASIHRHE